MSFGILLGVVLGYGLGVIVDAHIYSKLFIKHGKINPRLAPVYNKAIEAAVDDIWAKGDPVLQERIRYLETELTNTKAALLQANTRLNFLLDHPRYPYE